MPPDVVALGTLGAAGMFLPNFATVRKADPDDEGVQRDLMMGGLAGTLVSFGIVAGMAQRDDSARPLIVWAMMVGIVGGIYWYAYKREK